jgi:hypothetical protein
MCVAHGLGPGGLYLDSPRSSSPFPPPLFPVPPSPRQMARPATSAVLALAVLLAAQGPTPAFGLDDVVLWGWRALYGVSKNTGLSGQSACRSCGSGTPNVEKRDRATFLASPRTPGLIYVVDANGNTVQSFMTANFTEVSAMTTVNNNAFVQTRFAGGTGGATGYAGDGLAANDATVRLHTPLAVAEDSQGNVFINDYGNRKIRLVNISTGLISTYADTSFMLFPRSMTVDTTTDTLIVADVGVRVKNASQTSAEYLATQGSERGAIYTVSSAGAFTLLAGGGNGNGAANAGQTVVGMRMLPYKVWYVAARHAIAWLDPLNSMIREFELTGANAFGIKVLVGTYSTTSSSAAANSLAGVTSSNLPISTLVNANYGWDNNVPITSSFAAGFGISADGKNIVFGSRGWVMGAAYFWNPALSTTQNRGAITHATQVPFQAANYNNPNVVQDAQPDWDGTGVLYLIWEEPGGNPSISFSWSRVPTGDGLVSIDGSGYGAGTPSPAGTFIVNSGRCTCGSLFTTAGGCPCYPGPKSPSLCYLGFYSAEGASSCTGCPEGFSTNVTGAAPGTCYACPKNTFAPSTGTNSNAGTTRGACTNCSAGFWTNGRTAAVQRWGSYDDCVVCPTGWLNRGAGSDCYPCPPGYQSAPTYQNNTNFNGVCTPCPPNTNASISGTTTCGRCPRGTGSFYWGTASCPPCPAGTEYKVPNIYFPQNGECTFCDPGRYQSLTGQFSCPQCPAASFSSSAGATSCAACPPGYGSGGVGSTACSACSASAASMNSGQSCYSCGAHRTTAVKYCASANVVRPINYFSFSPATGVFIYHISTWTPASIGAFNVNTRTQMSLTPWFSPSSTVGTFSSDTTRGILILLSTAGVARVVVNPNSLQTSASNTTVAHPLRTISTIYIPAAHDSTNQIGYFLTNNGTTNFLVAYKTDLTLFGSPLPLNPASLGTNITAFTTVLSAYTDQANGKAYFALSAAAGTASSILELNFATAFSTTVGPSSVRVALLPAGDGQARAVYSDGTTLYVGGDASNIVRLSASTLARTDSTFSIRPYGVIGDGAVNAIFPAPNGTETLLAVSFQIGTWAVTWGDMKVVYFRPGATLERLGGFNHLENVDSPYVGAVINGSLFALAQSQALRLPVKVCAAGFYGNANEECTACPAGSVGNYTGATNCAQCEPGSYSPSTGLSSW